MSTRGRLVSSVPGVDELAGPHLITVTTTSTTLVALLTAVSVALISNLKRITLIPEVGGVQIYWANGTATVASPAFPLGGIQLECTVAAIGVREFMVAAGTVKVQVIQEG